MITLSDVKKALLEKGITKTDAEIQAQLDLYDFSALVAVEQNRYSVEMWDKVLPINGVDAEVILQNRNDIPPNGAIYLIKREGVIITFQPHNPNISGCVAMTEQEGFSIAEAEVKKLAERNVDEQVLQQIVNVLSQ
jgi:hypothetical protein